MALNQKIYSDIDFTFTKRPGVGDIALSYDDNAVIRSVRNLLLTNFYERPFQPNLGSNMSGLLFEPATNITSAILSDEVRNVVTNFEPRAQISNIGVTLAPDNNSFNVYLSFFY